MSLSCHWDDLTLNSREELIKMFGELELPIFENATKQELVTMLNLYLKNPNDKSIAQMYAKRKKHFRFPFHKFRMFTITLFIMILIYICFIVNDDDIRNKNNLNKCKENMFLSIVGCRNKKFKKLYMYAYHISIYISKLEGDCIYNHRITSQEFKNKFSMINLSFYEIEKGFGIYVDNNNNVRSSKPIASLNCRIIKSMEKRIQIYGFIFMGIFIILTFLFIKKKQHKKTEHARELANQALKILSSINKYAYAYDIKVQLRAKEPNIDSLWKYIVKYVEENQHVTVRVARTRNEVYWKWSV